MRFRNLGTAVVIGAVVATLLPAAAGAKPPTKSFGPAIEGYLGYQSQRRCDPAAKPGVLAFRSIVLRAYPGTGLGGIGRACNIGGTSEHKEGRAWDWTVNVGVPYQRAAAESLIEWLLKEDRYGNDAAMARRFGIMYIIWNRKIWGTWGGWSVYCKPKPRGCVDPDDGGLRHPHTDHVHFSFTWPGAKKKTTYWHKNMSLLSGLASNGYGYWALGRNGSVAPFGASYLGSLADRIVQHPAVSIAATPSGYGYWIASRNGGVKAFGDAPYKGSAKGDTNKLAGIVPHPSGSGYWLYASGGTVFEYGKAAHYGGIGAGDSKLVGMASTATGLGYWLVTPQGKVHAFGDAVDHGSATDVSDVAGIVATRTGLGYWLYTKKGRVIPFGDAGFFGGLAGKNVGGGVVGMAPSAAGLGYWLVSAKGKLKAFGDAPDIGKFNRSSERIAPPAGLAPSLTPED